MLDARLELRGAVFCRCFRGAPGWLATPLAACARTSACIRERVCTDPVTCACVRGTLNQAAFVARVEQARVRALATTRSAKVYPELFCSGPPRERRARSFFFFFFLSFFLPFFLSFFLFSSSPFLFSASTGVGGGERERARARAAEAHRHFCSSSP